MKHEPAARKYVDLKHTVVVEEPEGETEENTKKESEEYGSIIVKDGDNENENEVRMLNFPSLNPPIISNHTKYLFPVQIRLYRSRRRGSRGERGRSLRV